MNISENMKQRIQEKAEYMAIVHSSPYQKTAEDFIDDLMELCQEAYEEGYEQGYGNGDTDRIIAEATINKSSG